MPRKTPSIVRQSLQRGFELGQFLAGCAIPLAAVTLGIFAYTAIGHHGYWANKPLVRAYEQLTEKPLPKTAQAALVRLKAAGVGDAYAPMNRAAAYQDVRASRGEAVAIASLTPTNVDLIGRKSEWRDAVQELRGDSSYHYHFTTLWTGRMNWSEYLRVELYELLGLLALVVLRIIVEPFRLLRRQQIAARKYKQTLTRWQEFIPSESIGPSEPLDGFSLWVATLDEREDGSVAFSAWSKRWHDDESRWNGHSDTPPANLRPVILPAGSEFTEISTRWADFCAAVVTENSRIWEQTRLAIETRQLQAKAATELARIEAERKRSQRPLKELLPSGQEMARELTSR